jgi:ribosomal subunit interface protein
MTVEVQIFARNIDVTARIKDYVTKKAIKLDRYLSEIEEIKVELAYIKSARSASDRQVAQITVRGRRTILRTVSAPTTSLPLLMLRSIKCKGSLSASRESAITAAGMAGPPQR